ncbi:MAG: hypothetical protein WC603_03190 [Candidatus Paceibacterota bacterium]|jgi:hypothetical protein
MTNGSSKNILIGDQKFYLGVCGNQLKLIKNMETMITYIGQELSGFCGNFGCSRITGESDWSLRKRFFVKTFTLNSDLATEILFGIKFEAFTEADDMMYLSLFVNKKKDAREFTKDELQKYVNGFNVDPLVLRQGRTQPAMAIAVESVDYKTLSKEEFKKRLVAIIASSRSKKEIKNRVHNELQYGLPYSFSIYYGTMNLSTAIISGSGVRVVTTQLYHPEGNIALGWD